MTVCLLFALIAVSVNSVLGAELDEGVLVLTDANFDEEIKKHEYLLVEFYAPWCGHCKKLTPEYITAAATLAKNDPPFFVAKVDATEQKKVAEEYGIQGFPTLKWFHNGEATDYQGGRTADAIVSWILKKTGPSSVELSCAALKEKTESEKFSIVYFGSDISHELYTEAHAKFSDTEDKI
jgi:protein disulfide-isomerase A1